MWRHLRRLRGCGAPRFRGGSGFSLVEVLVAGIVLVVGLIAISQFFTVAGTRVLESDIRSVLHQIANQEMESIRGLPYEQVGTDIGHPSGPLKAEEWREVDGVWMHIQRAVDFHQDETYEGPYPANYRRVTLTLTAVLGEFQEDPLGGVAPVELVSYVAGGATGGAILVKVQDSQGEPVVAAQYTIVNSVKGINYSAPNQLTDAVGSMLVPGLTVDPDGNYEVTATKPGYSSDTKTDFPVLEAGLQEVVLTIDQLSSMQVRVVDKTTGLDLAGVGVNISGPLGYEGSVVTGATGVLVGNLRFSSESDPYIVGVIEGQGYSAEQTNVVLPPAAVAQQVVLEVSPVSVTTTLPPSTTSTTVAGTTTTLAGIGSLRVTVRNEHGDRIYSQAVVQLDSVAKSSRYNVVLFEYLQLREYQLVVSAPYYKTQEQTVTVTGADSITVYLERDWSW